MEPLIAPKVSVLIPVYNAEATVQSAVDSILRQTFRDFEIVAVDDGSTDGTGATLDAFAEREPRLRVIHTPNRRIIEALNTGIAQCRGELIARMDADDVSHPRRLEMQVALMDAQPEVSVCGCLVRMFPRWGLLGGLVRYEEWLNSLVTHEQIARDMFVESPIAHPSVMLRRQEMLQIGAYQERGWAEDYDLWLRYYLAGKRFAKVPSSLLFWRQSQGRLTFTDSRYSLENFLRAKAHYLGQVLRTPPQPSPHWGGSKMPPTPPQPSPRWGGSGGQRAVVLWGAGKTGRRLSKHLLRKGVDLEAVIDIDPAKIGHTLRGKPIVGVEYLGRFGISVPQVRALRQAQDADLLHSNPEIQDPQTSGDRPFVIVAVGSRIARELIREQLGAFGYIETRDYICAA